MKLSKQKGGVMLEAVIFLPLFIIGIFFFIWSAFYFNAKSSLSASMIRSLRLSIPRANQNLNTTLANEVTAWQTNAGQPSTRLQTLLASAGMNWNKAQSLYDNEIISVFKDPLGMWNSATFDMMPSSSYAFALIYTYESFKQSVGSSVKYPCNPDLDTAENGDSCLMCVFIHPDSTMRDPRSNFSNSFSGPYSNMTPSATALGLRCRYKPNMAILRPALNMVNLLTAGSASDIGVIDVSVFYGGL